MGERNRVHVLGGGVSGYFCANFLKARCPEAKVTIVERGAPLGRILVSGNGRCNVYNTNLIEGKLPEDPLFERAREIISDGSGKRAFEEFQRLFGVPCYANGILVYPFSNRSDTVQSAILEVTDSLGIERIKGEVLNVSPDREVTVSIDGQKQRIGADYVVMCLGGQCLNYPAFDWSILKDLDLKIVPYTAALGPVGIEEDLSSLDGYRVKGTLSLLDRGKEVYREDGEVLFRPRAISGICAFNCSIRIEPRRVHDYQLKLDMSCHDGTRLDTERFEVERSLPLPVAKYLRDQAARLGVDVSSLVSDLRFQVRSLPEFKASQVSRGGIAFAELNPKNMELVRHPGIYALGEMIDVPLHCGGYNIGMCMVEGYKAARDIAHRIGYALKEIPVSPVEY